MILIRGAGDIATGIALRLYRSGYPVAMTDLSAPTSIRRTVCFSEAIRLNTACVEHVTAERCESLDDCERILLKDRIPVFPDDEGHVKSLLAPEAIVDARLAKHNIDTALSDAPVVIGVGPGFTAGTDCSAVVETQRGHFLGRVFYMGSAAPDTGIPGSIGGYSAERIVRAPEDGTFYGTKQIGDTVAAGETVAEVNGIPVKASIPGVLRGLLPDGTPVVANMKSGDVDPRGQKEYCYEASDKALAVGGGVLEALLHFGVMPSKK